MREIVLDTETTGLKANDGDRVVEIGCIELINHLPTGRKFHKYINPERSMPQGAFAVHGLSEEFLAQHSVFAEVVGDFLDFIGEAPLVIHNASFDMGFLNAELKRVGMPPLPKERAIDTVLIARRRFPGAQASLDALCRRFEIDNSNRTLHGALLDAQLLAECYLELLGGRQAGLGLTVAGSSPSGAEVHVSRLLRDPRPHNASVEELAAHEIFLAQLKNPIWRT